MADEAFHEKLRAHRAHMAAVPIALAALRNAPGDRIVVEVSLLNTLIAEVERLQALVKQQQKDMADEQREFQREARDIAAEARWQERQERDEWGSY